MKIIFIILTIFILSCEEVELIDCYTIKNQFSFMRNDTIFISYNESYTCNQIEASQSEIIVNHQLVLSCEECELKNN